MGRHQVFLTMFLGLWVLNQARAAQVPSSAQFIGWVRGADKASLEAYLNQGGSPDAVDPNGDSLPVLARRFERVDLLSLLCQRGAKSRHCDPYDAQATAALLEAARRFDTQAMTGALSRGADPTVHIQLDGDPAFEMLQIRCEILQR